MSGKLVNLVNECINSITCRFCNQQAYNPVHTITCGHLFCNDCVAKFNITNSHHPKCPVCEEAVESDKVDLDDFINSLYSKTVDLKNLICNNDNETVDDLSNDTVLREVNVDNKENEVYNETLNILEPPTAVEIENNLVPNVDKSIYQMVTYRSVDIQCDLITAQPRINDKIVCNASTEVQCDLQLADSKRSRTVETQTKSIGTKQIAIQHTPMEPKSCFCIKDNLKKILELNICNSFNAIIQGLLDIDNCSNSQKGSSRNDTIVSQQTVPNKNDSGLGETNAMPSSAAINNSFKLAETQTEQLIHQEIFARNITKRERKDKFEHKNVDHLKTPESVVKAVPPNDGGVQAKNNEEVPKQDVKQNRPQRRIPKENKTSFSKPPIIDEKSLKASATSNKKNAEVVENSRRKRQIANAAPVNDIGNANGSRQQSDVLLPTESEGLPIVHTIDDISSPPKIVKKEKSNVEKSQRKRKMATVADSNSNLKSGIMSVPLLKESNHVLSNTLASTTSSKSKLFESSVGSTGDSTKEATIFKKPEMGKATTKKAKLEIVEKRDMEVSTEANRTDVSNATQRSIRQRSYSREKSSLVIMSSGLGTSQKRKLEKNASLGFELVSEWSPSVTHLVVDLVPNVKKSELLTKRSMKYLMALLGNKWIVSFDWVTVCEKSNRLVDESKFEIRGYRGGTWIEAPHKSRTEKVELLRNCAFYFNVPFEKFVGDLKELREVLEAGKGNVVASPSELFDLMANDSDVRCFVVNDTDQKTLVPNLKTATHLTANELIDSISNLKPL